MNLLRRSGFGYEFDASKCELCGGKCCTGESGYIWISSAEISALAEHLKMMSLDRDFWINSDINLASKKSPTRADLRACFLTKRQKTARFTTFARVSAAPFRFGTILRIKSMNWRKNARE